LQGNFGSLFVSSLLGPQKFSAQLRSPRGGRLVTPPATVVIPAGSASGSPPVPWKAPMSFGDVQVVGGMWEWVGVVPAEGISTPGKRGLGLPGLEPWERCPVNPERSRRVPAPFGFLCKEICGPV
jgi:hypothetical protein